LFNPENSLNEVSFVNLYKIYNPATIKPKLVNVFTGSLKIPSLTLSHHLEAWPIIAKLSAVTDWSNWK